MTKVSTDKGSVVVAVGVPPGVPPTVDNMIHALYRLAVDAGCGEDDFAVFTEALVVGAIQLVCNHIENALGDALNKEEARVAFRKAIAMTSEDAPIEVFVVRALDPEAQKAEHERFMELRAKLVGMTGVKPS